MAGLEASRKAAPQAQWLAERMLAERMLAERMLVERMLAEQLGPAAALREAAVWGGTAEDKAGF